MKEKKPSVKRLVQMGLKFFYKSGKGSYKDPEAYDYIVEKLLGRKKIAQDLVDTIQKLVPLVDKQKPPKILDLATGTGVISLELAKRGYNTHATDISKDMIALLLKKALNSSKLISLNEVDLNDKLPYLNNHFSVITTAHANRYITNMDNFLNEVYRVLQVDGYFVWVLVASEIIPWKRNLGILQPTTCYSLKKHMISHGFKNIQQRVLKVFIRQTLKGVPFYTIPAYLIGQK